MLGVDARRQRHDMKRLPIPQRRIAVAILLPRRVLASYVFLTQEMLLLAGTMKARSRDVAGCRLFDIDFLSPDGGPVLSFGASPIQATGRLGAGSRHEIVIVPGQFAPDPAGDEEDSLFGAFLRERFAAGATLVGLNGAILLAKAGLLDGRSATGLSGEKALFAQYFPSVRYTPAKRLVVDERVITASGVNPAVDACAYLIDRYFGAGTSQHLLRVALTQTLPSYEHMAVWTAQFKQHGDGPILAVQEILERELVRPPELAQLATQAAVSERSLSRRFAAATGSNLRQYLAALRLELAAFLLRTGRWSLDHIAGECGFASASALSRAFSARFGQSPARYRKQPHPSEPVGRRPIAKTNKVVVDPAFPGAA